MYADTITESMQKTIDETARRRSRQIAYNEAHGIVPKTIIKAIDNSLGTLKGGTVSTGTYVQKEGDTKAAEAQVYKTEKELQRALQEAKKNMEKAVKEMDFLNAAKWRDEMLALQERLGKK